jgi:predicted nucleic acid-binding protein
MPAYVDTSALLRMVEGRGDCSLVEAAFREVAMSSELAELECWVAIHKRWHDGELSLGERDRLLDATRRRAIDPLVLLRMDGDVQAEARGIAGRFPVRTLDALHVATALLADRRTRPTGRSLRFCTADVRQAAAARGVLGTAQVDLLPSPA